MKKIMLFLAFLTCSIGLIAMEQQKEINLYKILGVARNATPYAIEKRYLRLTKYFLHKTMQSLNVIDEKVEEKFDTIRMAYNILSDRQKRKAYDEKMGLTTSEVKEPNEFYEHMSYVAQLLNPSVKLIPMMPLDALQQNQTTENIHHDTFDKEIIDITEMEENIDFLNEGLSDLPEFLKNT